jgi:hypothetical protein
MQAVQGPVNQLLFPSHQWMLGIAKAHGGTFRHENNRQVNRARLFIMMPSSETKRQGRCRENVPKGSMRVNVGAVAGEMD